MKSPALDALLLLVAASLTVRAANPAALDEVLKLKNAGIDQDTILAFVQSRNLDFDLTADDTIALQRQGFSPSVLAAMLSSGKANVVGIPTSPPAPVSPPVAPAPVLHPPPLAVPAIGSDVAYFYQELGPYGRWFLTDKNEWCWQPHVAVRSRDWRPYWDGGRWVHTDGGWYWASDYSWGWAPFHYGRWDLHPHHGWIWLPDRVWGPAWVVWREGGDYCGWAPLPPGARYDAVHGAFLWNGRHVTVDFDFGLDWVRFGFVSIRSMGESPRTHFRRPDELRDVFRRSTVVHRYTVARTSDGPPRVVNHGIPVERVNAGKSRKLEMLRIEDARSPHGRRPREQVDRDTHVLRVYRPRMDDKGPKR